MSVTTVFSSKIEGVVRAPASKSVTQRMLAGALLAQGTSILRNVSDSDDARAAMNVIRQLGAVVTEIPEGLEVRGGLSPVGQKLECGEAGLSIRMFPPIAALTGKNMVLTGTGSLMNRPVNMVAEALIQLGVQCETRGGLPPLWIKGTLKGGELSIDGSLSSQLLTGLLMALPAARQDSVIRVNNLQSRPYVDLTLEILEKFGIRIVNEEYKIFSIPGRQQYKPADLSSEGDWSGAAFMLVAGAIAGTMSIDGLNQISAQADRRILDVIRETGAEVDTNDDRITVTRKFLKPFDFDATHCPDLFPPLAALAAHCKGSSRISGVGRLKNKESNRAEALKTELGKMGIPIRYDAQQMYITGPARIRSAVIDPHGDHRIAMAAAVAVLNGQAEVSIEEAACVNKSYPAFFNDLIQSGGKVT